MKMKKKPKGKDPKFSAFSSQFLKPVCPIKTVKNETIKNICNVAIDRHNITEINFVKLSTGARLAEVI